MIMTEKDWKSRIRQLPKGLTLQQAATRLKVKYHTARHWIKRINYKFSDGRQFIWTEQMRLDRAKVDPSKLDWSKPNVVLARENKISRERIRQLRNARNQTN